MSIALTDLFLTSIQRMDRWRTLFRHAAHAAAVADPGELAKIRTEFQRMRVLEDYWGYPGRMLNNELERLLTDGDLQSFANGVHITSAALHPNALRSLEGAWHLDSNPSDSFDELANTGVGKQTLPRPYFEVLVVAADMPALWDFLTDRTRGLRRPTDGFPFRNRRNLPDLRGFLGKRLLPSDPDEDELAVSLFDTVKEVRPELDRYLLSNRLAEQVSGLDAIAAVRRVFFSTEDIPEIHLSILEGMHDRFQTPFFDNLEKYAQRPIGTFHALSIARVKSIFKSNWIRDMREFYGENLFLAESSAKPCSNLTTSCSSIAIVTSPITTPVFCLAPSRSISMPFPHPVFDVRQRAKPNYQEGATRTPRRRGALIGSRRPSSPMRLSTDTWPTLRERWRNAWPSNLTWCSLGPGVVRVCTLHPDVALAHGNVRCCSSASQPGQPEASAALPRIRSAGNSDRHQRPACTRCTVAVEPTSASASKHESTTCSTPRPTCRISPHSPYFSRRATRDLA